MNAVLEVGIDTTNPANASVECTFESEYSCTIDYGMDPSYSNLVYRDYSTTLDQVAIITLSQELQKDTTYYVLVSAESGSKCVRVCGRFRTGECIYSGVR